MKRLFLLRHAQALSAYGTSDFERKLSDEGHAEARALGRVMKNNKYQPDIIYCSPALRTQQTLEGILQTVEERPTDSPHSIYESSSGEILALIQNTASDIENILIVAHNPSIHQLAAMLAEDGSENYERLMMGYAPGTLSVFECNLEHWKNIQPNENALVALLAAPNYTA